MCRVLIIVGVVWTLLACSQNPLKAQWQSQLATQTSINELPGVPFYPQESFQCGPAALASLLGWIGDEVTPDSLTEQLFISGRKGSLQIEMLATARRHGFVAYEHAGGLQDLLLQLQQGAPVLILQNLGLSWVPTWHYSVVVGYDAKKQRFLLRSGEQRLRQTDVKAFSRTWHYSEQWMMTLHKPGDIPAGADALQYVRAVSGLERVQQSHAALLSYRAASNKWPQSDIVWMALGNNLYQAQEFLAAQQAYEQAYIIAPQKPAAAHNLAWALIKQNKLSLAKAYAEKAAQLSSEARYQSALQALSGRSVTTF